MVIEYVRYRLDETKLDAFVDAYRQAAKSLDESPECLGYELSQCVEEPERFILRIQWTSVAAHLEGFRKSEHFRSFFAAIRPYVSNIEEMQHYEVTNVVSTAK